IKCIISNMLPFPLSNEYDNQILDLNTKLKALANQKNVMYVDVYHVVENLPVFETNAYLLNSFGDKIWNRLLINSLSDENETKKPSKFSFDYKILSAERIKRILKESPSKVTVCMLGNSITAGANWNNITGGKFIRNCGQGGYTTGQMLWHMDTTVIAANPSHCFVMGGINDFSMGLDYTVVFENYKEIIRRIKLAGIKPVLQSTLYQNEGSNNNKIVKRLNEELKQLCEKEQIDFLDINSVLSKNEALIMKYSTDGTHLNKSGYEKWGKLLASYLNKHKIKF
ncbi:MAG: GDSL-type esterase/lipase family protein, partial [Bacteroidales bacterium]|nr:GDSL-type esterase/lipase family protein [Bacteroidales bacterium]